MVIYVMKIYKDKEVNKNDKNILFIQSLNALFFVVSIETPMKIPGGT
jgi:hypothetical protein